MFGVEEEKKNISLAAAQTGFGVIHGPYVEVNETFTEKQIFL